MTTDPSQNPLTAAQRKAAQRQRQRDQGLVKLELWAPPEQHAAIKRYADRLRLRAGLQEQPPPPTMAAE